MTENGPTPNPLANEMNIFKEEVLQKIKEIETKLTSEITNKELALNADYQNFTSQINLLMNNNKEMISTIVSQKLKLEKVSELESFKNKVDSMLITHEIRIKNNTDEIGKSQNISKESKQNQSFHNSKNNSKVHLKLK